jgi:hypothetical protein
MTEIFDSSGFRGGNFGSKYKTMRLRAGSKSFQLMPISLNMIKFQFISANTCASASKKPGDFIALI